DVSNNGGSTYTTLEVITGITGASNAVRSFDISGFIAADTRVRFRVTNLFGGTNETMFIDDVRISGNVGVSSAFRVTEYYLAPGSFTGTSFDLTLDQALVADYFAIVQGSDGDGSGGDTRNPSTSLARLTQDPFGTGDLGTSSGADVLRLERTTVSNDWSGVVTVVECLTDCDTLGFRLRSVDAVTHTGSTTSGTDTAAASWTDVNQTTLIGGPNGSGCTSATTSADNFGSCFTRLVPTGTDTINWTRDTNLTGNLATGTSTVMAVEWGSSWTVQCTRVQGTITGSNGAAAAAAYATSAISSVNRANTWVWGSGFTDDNGIGDSAEAVLITLGDGVTQNASETTVAVGLENGDDVDFQVCAMTHPSLAVDYQFKADGDSGNIIVDQAVDSAAAGARMALVTNGQNGTGNAFPRPLLSARYFNDTTVRLERRRSGQDFPAWVQGVDFSGLGARVPTVLDNNPGSSDPALADGTPVNLVEASDGYELDPGETLTIEFQVTVDTPIPAGVTGYTCPTTVNSNEGDPDSDSAFNLVGQPGIIGDFVWFDLDSDGVQDPAEPGIPGARVNLHAGTSCDSPVLATVLTDADGFYLFDDLPAGDYCVELYEATLPPLYTLTTAGKSSKR
ncbi:MAG: SdrD B-like domain-containing protein, partial [Acidobacteriota bacterium]